MKAIRELDVVFGPDKNWHEVRLAEKSPRLHNGRHPVRTDLQGWSRVQWYDVRGAAVRTSRAGLCADTTA